MKDSKDLMEYRKRRIQSGKNARIYGSVFYILMMTIMFIIEDIDVYPFILFLIFIYLIMITLMTMRLNNEKRKLSDLLSQKDIQDFEL